MSKLSNYCDHYKSRILLARKYPIKLLMQRMEQIWVTAKDGPTYNSIPDNCLIRYGEISVVFPPLMFSMWNQRHNHAGCYEFAVIPEECCRLDWQYKEVFPRLYSKTRWLPPYMMSSQDMRTNIKQISKFTTQADQMVREFRATVKKRHKEQLQKEAEKAVEN